MSLRSALAAVLPAALLLVGCDSTAGTPEPTPVSTTSPLVATAAAALPAILQPPAGPITAGDDSAAAQALAAAGRLTADAGSLRMKLAAHVGAPGAGRHLDVTATGEAESATRSTVRAVIDLSGRRLVAESAVYDGKSYSRNEGEAWHLAISGGSQPNPQGYTNFVAHASGVVDSGPGLRDGIPAEEFKASSSGSATDRPSGPTASSTAAAAKQVQLVAWVEKTGGHLVGLDLVFPDIGAGQGTMSIDFSDFGATIKVAPPVLTP